MQLSYLSAFGGLRRKLKKILQLIPPIDFFRKTNLDLPPEADKFDTFLFPMASFCRKVNK
ncbi:MAG: hypothetical protein B6D44_13270 [Ignavibacteriales bacterium UTCHB2]|nr:MAG: hypothetical protein B6D44_13270 [Ignavibacteriales bacterium UTCHB2]